MWNSINKMMEAACTGYSFVLTKEIHSLCNTPRTVGYHFKQSCHKKGTSYQTNFLADFHSAFNFATSEPTENSFFLCSFHTNCRLNKMELKNSGDIINNISLKTEWN